MDFTPGLTHWLLAALPIVALIVLMVAMRWTAQQAGTTGIFIASAIAVLAFATPLDTLAVASAKGVWDALFILYVIWPALLLYHVMSHSGGYDALRRGIELMSRNELFVIVALGWVFASFLQGIDGFGTPIAVVAPLLVAFGMRPVYAVAIPIIAHIWAKFYGTLGVGWLATLQVVDIDAATTASTALQAALLISIQAVLGGFTIVWLYGRWAAIRSGWPLVLVIAAIQGLGQVAAVYVDPVLAAFLPATAALVALIPLSRWSRYREPDASIVDRPAMLDHASRKRVDAEPPMGLWTALAPYGLLTVLALCVSMIDPLHSRLDAVAWGLAFPEVATGLGMATAAAAQYSALRPFSHPGAYILLTALLTFVVFHRRGYFRKWAEQHGEQPARIVPELLQGAVPASIPIIAFLVMASIMKHSGQNLTLAMGIAAVAPAYVFAFLSNAIGILGAFMTSSSTSSQVIFSDVQMRLAQAKGLPVSTILAAQSAGGAIGNAIAPANVVMGASTAGIAGQEGEILRKTLPWTVLAFVLTGVATVLLALFMQ
ncbi:L-lactate permease [Bordetella bronchiseptica MBORD675]|uniref:L-lactate permease n=1 Tax=Bordetella bronchiseptica TaxID=518 RepID=UPI00028AA852|nr:L-lactate permease [Bordetella bronchiseptica]KCV32333.1 L-lactate permease [Bordetella bronchiseptica 00-P-2730]AUL14240.1 lactate permease [Bordetella bronchiseptica]AWP57331.1 lactate permease [Bordetella bronchiseptica]KAK68395.1 L-lactate permease [Bordetella bronchiseptica MO211]KAK72363.1 L-lactate permease [Bordetella bronchiseptica CA90 BB02]